MEYNVNTKPCRNILEFIHSIKLIDLILIERRAEFKPAHLVSTNKGGDRRKVSFASKYV